MRGYPRGEFERDILVCVSPSIASGLGDDTFGVGLFHPLFDGKDETVQSGLVFNSLEFGGIKIRIVHLLPYAQKLDGILVTQPLFNKGGTVFHIADHVGQGDIILVIVRDDCHFCILDFNFSHVLLTVIRLLLVRCTNVRCIFRNVPPYPEKFVSRRLLRQAVSTKERAGNTG